MLLVIRLVLALLAGGLLAAALLNAFEGDWESVVLDAVGAVALIVTVALLGMGDEARHRAAHRRELRSQDRRARAEILALKRIGTGSDEPRFDYRIELLVHPPDLPPYRTHIERDVDPLTEADVYKKGRMVLVRLIDAESGEVEVLHPLRDATPPVSAEKTVEWAAIRSQYLDADAAAGAPAPASHSDGWRGLRLPEVRRIPRWHRPLLSLTVAGGFAAALLVVFDGALSSTVERLRLGELDPSVHSSSVRARDAAEDAVQRAGSDEIHSLYLRDTGYQAEIQAPDSLKVGTWRVAADGTLLPGAFREWSDATFAAPNSMLRAEAFDIDDVPWAAIPEVRAEGTRICESRYEADLEAVNAIRIRSVGGTIRFEFMARLDTGESCTLEFDADAREIER
ncbi:MAG: hypothetical protein GXX90_02745 [Microbacteriaceae bacterium]|nr:hypothetical protein [Microbacteriaceae bacterium]